MTCDHGEHRGLVTSLDDANSRWHGCTYLDLSHAPTYLGNPHDHPIWQELADALDAAMTKHPPMNSPHEGWAVIYEELIVELGEHVWHDTGRSAEARKEAIQVAAMGLRYALDLCGGAR